jgi:hypothetical protein
LLPAASERRIRRLHVRAAAADEASGASTLLADAFRTASLPIADAGRLIVIRRLALGRISMRVSSASLALHIERVTREAMSGAGSWDMATARDVNAVAFRGHSEAIVSLARFHARGAPADEWFWPSIVPQWRSCTGRAERWVLLLDTAHRLPEGAVAAAAALHEAIRCGGEDALLGSVTSAACTTWLALHGWSSIGNQHGRQSSPLQAAQPQVVERWRRRWDSEDHRLVWLGTLCAVQENPARAADPQLAARVARALGDRFEDHAADRREVAPIDRPSSPASPDAAAGTAWPADLPVTLPKPVAAQRVATQPVATEPVAAEPVTDPARSDPVAEPPGVEPEPQPWNGDFTPFGGLFFVVPILDRLGFADHLAANPTLLESYFPGRLLWSIGARAGMAMHDPLAVALEPYDSDLGAMAACALTDLPANARHILSSPIRSSTLTSPLTAWVAAVRRWSRRSARLGLATLVRRPARVHVSRTHLDICFELSDLDVRVRRMALDLDPGWVPWLGRVVQFHYVDGHRSSR